MEASKETAILGHIHPISSMIRDIQSAFRDMGFEIALGPELEDEFHNFDALNFPKDHPARDMQDTFWIKNAKGKMESAKNDGKNVQRMVMRTHTSSVQIRYMETHKPPIRILVPGKVYRNEATDATHEAQFFQIEALYVDKRVSLAMLKGTLEHMFRKIFGDEIGIRFRPSFFPFVEPGVEVDMRRKGKWLEMGGAGLVHPEVFRAVRIDPAKWQGFAFGFGLDRLVMLKYGIDDIRLLYSGDLRLINQF